MHTTTDLVERHIGLLKIQAESGRYGIELGMEELAAEAAMSQNLTMSVVGYTPSILLFGVLPRGFLEPEAEHPHGDITAESLDIN